MSNPLTPPETEIRLDERKLPFNVEAEQAVLGSLLLDGSTYLSVAHIVRPDDFYLEKQKWMYEVIDRLAIEKKPVDFLSVTSELERLGKLDKIGGASFVTALLNSVPTAAHIEYYANLVAKAAYARRVIQHCTDIAEQAYKELESDELHALWANTVMGETPHTNNKFKSAWEVGMENDDDIKESIAHPKEVWGIPSGFPQFDEAHGGWQDGGYYVIAANSSVGKTFFLISCLLNLAYRGIACGIVSMEMSNKQLYYRFIGMMSGVPSYYIRRGLVKAVNGKDKEEWRRFDERQTEAVFDAQEKFKHLPIYFSEDGLRTASQMRSAFLKLIMQHGVRVGAADYLQLQGNGNGRDNRNNELGGESRQMQAIARDYGKYGFLEIVLSQLSRENTKRDNKRPQLSDLRDSGDIEQTADVVEFLNSQEYWDLQAGKIVNQDTAELTVEGFIAKDRLSNAAGKTIVYAVDRKTRYYRDVTSLNE